MFSHQPGWMLDAGSQCGDDFVIAGRIPHGYRDISQPLRMADAIDRASGHFQIEFLLIPGK